MEGKCSKNGRETERFLLFPRRAHPSLVDTCGPRGNRYGHRTEIPPNKDIILADRIYSEVRARDRASLRATTFAV